MSSSKIHETFKRMFSHAGVIGCCVIDREASRVVHARGSKSIVENNFVAAVSSLLTKINNLDETAFFTHPEKKTTHKGASRRIKESKKLTAATTTKATTTRVTDDERAHHQSVYAYDSIETS